MFFDFHCHPGLKANLSPAGKEPSPWQNITVQALLLRSIKVNISSAFADSLDSQASLQQLWRGGVNLFGLIIHSLENKMAAGLLEKSIIRAGNVLQLDPVKLQRSAEGKSYFQIAMDEIKRLEANSEPPGSMGLPAGVEFKIIKSMDEYDASNPNVLHGILIFEGSQNLFDDPDAPDAGTQFFKNLDTLSMNYRLFAMNVCHFQQQPIANHAFAMQFLNSGPFYPTGRGITEWGFTAIQELYKRGIVIDTKHMGLHARKELYRMRQEKGITVPLICSHAGVTGISEMKRLDYIYLETPIDAGPVWKMRFLKKWGHVSDTAYNMISLNLYDEDIEFILLSGGLIGISLDQRIIGFPADEGLLYSQGVYPTDMDCISKLEQDVFFGKHPTQWKPRVENNNEVMNFDDADRQNAGFTTIYHANYFLNQVLHILFVAKHSQRGLKVADAMKSICIGSDLDGLVNSLDCCLSTVSFQKFKDQLTTIVNKKSFWKGTGFTFGEINTATLLDGIFFNNAETFLRKHFL